MGEQKRVASTKIIYHASAEAAREGRNRVKLLYLDQQTITRVAIATWLQRIQRRFDIESGDYDIAKLETKIGLKHVDLLLMNIGVESAEPLNSLPALARLFPTVPIVLITSADNPDLIVRTWRYGVRGVINPDMDQHQVVQALCLVHSGEASFPAETLSRCFDRRPQLVCSTVDESGHVAPNPDMAGQDSESLVITPTAPRELSSRERQVHHCLQQGHSNKHIARSLCISENTVKVYVQRIKLKLGL